MPSFTSKQIRRKSCLLLAGGLLFLANTGTAQTAAPGAATVGPLAAEPCLTVYAVVGKEPESARLTVARRGRPEGDRLMVRAFDPDERLTWWQYLEPGAMKSAFGPGDEEVWGIPVSNPIDPKKQSLFLDTNLPLKGEGVHQIRVGAGANNSVVSLAFSHTSSYGVSFQNGTYNAWKGQPKTMYVFIPPHAEYLEITGGPVRLLDESGREVLATPDANVAKTLRKIDIAPASIGKVWRVEFPQPERWTLRAAGFPFILCSSPEAAQAIHGSVEELPDGTLIAHKFQKRIHDLLPKLLAAENVGNAEDIAVSKITDKEPWLKEPEKSLMFFNSVLQPIGPDLLSQNVDASDSYWSGSIGAKEALSKLAPPENRWDRLGKGLWAGLTSRYATHQEQFALGALINVPYNPYYGKKELLYRAAAVEMRNLMALRESETWGGATNDASPYPGNMAFAVGEDNFPVYSLVAQHLPADIRAAWTEGLRHIVDRAYPDVLVTCRNQSSHYLTCFEQFAEGSGDPRYKELATVYARRFIDGLSPAGYAMEQNGPDGSYNGMTHWHMALYYQESKDPAMLEAIRKSYTFFNHTVAPEPDGSMLGGCNFNHRVGDNFAREQWGGARGIVNSLPEVALWATIKSRRNDTNDAPRLLEKQLGLSLTAKPEKYGSGLDIPRFVYWEEPNTSGTWPALETQSFTRNFANELVAVKRPGYYLVVFVGKPAPSDFYVHNKDKFRAPLPNNAENSGGTGGDAPGFTPGRFITPLVGGGLSSFWTPAYGNSLLATNWSPLTHHGLVATVADGKRYWERYLATSFSLSPDNNNLVVSGEIEGTPVKYQRSYRFDDQELGVDLTLTAEKDVRLKRLIENIPLKIKPGEVKIEVEGETNGQAKAARIVATEGPGKGVEIVFDQPRELAIQRNGLQRKGLQVGRAEVVLPVELKAGASVRLHYTLRALSAKP